jgi:nucleotide-binding universal stress UspA family protein
VVGDAEPRASVLADLEQRVERYRLPRPELFVVDADAPGAAVVDHVSGRDGALLVIASTAHGGSDEHQLGAVTDEVLRRTRQPVMVAGPRAELSPGGLVVVVDGAGFADAALPVVERWSATFGDRGIRILEVQAPDRWPEDVDDAPARTVDRYVEQLGGRGLGASGDVIRALDPVVGVLAGIARSSVAMVVVASPPDVGQPPSFQAISTQNIVDTVGQTLQSGSALIRPIPATGSANGGQPSVLVALVGVLNSVVNALGTVVSAALSPLLDPLLNTVLHDLLGIQLGQTEVGAQLTCMQGAELVF